MYEHIRSAGSLKFWLQKNYIKTGDFAKQVGCSRPVIWKAKRDIPICPLFAKRICELTKGEVNPKSNKVGRPW